MNAIKRTVIILTMTLLAASFAMAGAIGDGSITVSAAAQGISSIPDDTVRALITVETGAVRVGFKTAPTATTGILLNVNDSMNIAGFHDVNSLRIIRNTGIGAATVRYVLFGKN